MEKFLEDNPNATMDQIIDFMEKGNGDGKYNDLLGYLLGENDDFKTTPRDLNDIL